MDEAFVVMVVLPIVCIIVGAVVGLIKGDSIPPVGGSDSLSIKFDDAKEHIYDPYRQDNRLGRDICDTRAGMGPIAKEIFGESLLVDNPLLPE
jgi:hypothetical protein